MAILTDEQKKTFKPIVNGVWTLVVIALMIALGAKYLMSGYPPAFSWLEPFNELILSVGLIGGGVLIASRNPLVK